MKNVGGVICALYYSRSSIQLEEQVAEDEVKPCTLHRKYTGLSRREQALVIYRFENHAGCCRILLKRCGISIYRKRLFSARNSDN